MNAEISPQVQNQLVQLQQLQQQMQAIAGQKAQGEMTLRETESALKELEKLGEDAIVYKNVGEIMIKSDVNSLKESLSEKKETYDLRLKTLERQEERIQKRLQQLQQQLRQSLGITGAQAQ